MRKLEIGQKFERYSVLQILGSGGSGTSYEAEDLLLHRKVALKLIHPWLPLADSARRQFFRNMHGISLLAHPCHTPMLDYGEVEGQLYIVRQFVGHGSLLSPEGRVWFSPPLSIASALAYARQLAQVLYHIHRYGYVHGSLTLSNILVSHEPDLTKETDLGSLLLSDIGLAQFVRCYGKPPFTRFPITAAPEQWKGRCVPASDQYALAALVYFWIAGRPPFIGSPDEIKQAKAQASFPVLSSFNPQITLEQEGIIRRALSAHPDERYSNIISFVDALLTHIARHTKKTPPTQIDLPAQPAIVEALQLAPVEQPQSQPPSTASSQSSFDELLSTLHIVQPEVQSDELAHNGAMPSSLDSLEPISSTFLMDQETARRLTMLISGDPTVREPETSTDSPSSPLPAGAEPTLMSTLASHICAQLPPVPDNAQPSLELPTREGTPSMVAETVITEYEAYEAYEANGSESENTGAQEEQGPSHIVLRLVVTSSDHSDLVEYHFENDEITIGRAESSDMRLDNDPQASRHHAALRRRGNLYYLYDLYSTNGVFVNGKQLIPEIGYPLSDGESFQVCSYTFVLHIVPAHCQEPHA